MGKSYRNFWIILICTAIILIFTNPTLSSFKEYLGYDSKKTSLDIRKPYNFFLCSIYLKNSYPRSFYLGIVGNFFELNSFTIKEPKLDSVEVIQIIDSNGIDKRNEDKNLELSNQKKDNSLRALIVPPEGFKLDTTLVPPEDFVEISSEANENNSTQKNTNKPVVYNCNSSSISINNELNENSKLFRMLLIVEWRILKKSVDNVSASAFEFGKELAKSNLDNSPKKQLNSIYKIDSIVKVERLNNLKTKYVLPMVKVAKLSNCYFAKSLNTIEVLKNISANTKYSTREKYNILMEAVKMKTLEEKRILEEIEKELNTIHNKYNF